MVLILLFLIINRWIEGFRAIGRTSSCPVPHVTTNVSSLHSQLDGQFASDVTRLGTNVVSVRNDSIDPVGLILDMYVGVMSYYGASRQDAEPGKRERIITLVPVIL